MTFDEHIASKVTLGRTHCILDFPFYGIEMMRLNLQEDPTCETAWTDGRTLGYNPGYMENLKQSQVKGIVAHEGVHIVQKHHLRREGRDPETWNEACDFITNAILVDDYKAALKEQEDAKKQGRAPTDRTNVPVDLPEGYLYDPAFNNMSAEQIYNILHQRKREQNQSGGGGQGQGDSQSQESGVGKDPGKCGEVRDMKREDGTEMSQSERDAESSNIDMDVINNGAIAKAQGMLPASVGRMIQEIKNPKVDWKDVLRDFVTKAAKNDYSWMRPNKRYIHANLYLPSLYSRQMGTIAIGIDTSMSIRQKDLDNFAGEFNSIIEEFPGADVWAIYCDSEVHDPEHFEQESMPVTLDAKGGGGTDFVPVFDWIESEGVIPETIIYLTDGWCDSFPESTSAPVLWVLTEPCESFKPPFGETIVMDS